MTYWEDRLTDEQMGEVNKAFEKFRNGEIGDQRLYEALTNNGCTAEEADELCNLECQR